MASSLCLRPALAYIFKLDAPRAHTYVSCAILQLDSCVSVIAAGPEHVGAFSRLSRSPLTSFEVYIAAADYVFRCLATAKYSRSASSQ